MLEPPGGDDFFKAAAKIEGLEFLAEYDEDDIPPDDDFFVEKKGAREEYRGRVYLMFANQQAFRQLLNLWDTWQRGEDFQRGLTKWRDVFALLRDISPWSVRNRLEETGVLEDWRDRLTWERQRIPCEIEIWFRADEQQRAAASVAVRGQVQELGGEVVSEATVPRSSRARLSRSRTAVTELLDQDRRGAVALVRAERSFSAPLADGGGSGDLSRRSALPTHRFPIPSARWSRCSMVFRCSLIARWRDGSRSMTPTTSADYDARFAPGTAMASSSSGVTYITRRADSPSLRPAI